MYQTLVHVGYQEFKRVVSGKVDKISYRSSD